GVDADRLARLDQVAGDAVVAAALAERRRQSLKREGRQGQGMTVALDEDRRFTGHGSIASFAHWSWVTGHRLLVMSHWSLVSDAAPLGLSGGPGDLGLATPPRRMGRATKDS